MKKVPIDVDWSGNVFTILATFIRTAKKIGWSVEEINEVLDEATSMGYTHLLETMRSRTVDINRKDWHPIVKL
jgi:hypothetical protein